MKRQFLFSALLVTVLAFTSMVFTSCNDDDDLLPEKKVPQTALALFQASFPGVTPEWSYDDGKLKAEFWQGQIETEMWFTRNGQTWLWTETDWYQPLPAAVQAYIDANYAGYKIDDIDYVTTPNDAYFQIEMEKNNRRDVILRIREDGTVVK